MTFCTPDIDTEIVIYQELIRDNKITLQKK